MDEEEIPLEKTEVDLRMLNQAKDSPGASDVARRKASIEAIEARFRAKSEQETKARTNETAE